MPTVYLKIAVALALSVVAIAFVERINRIILDRKIDVIAPLLVGGIVRLGFFVVIYLIWRWPVLSDVSDFYYPQSVSAWHGGLWNADFESMYSPLFPYVGAALFALWNDLRIFVLVALCVDTVGIWFWHTLLRRCVTREDALNISMCYALSAPVILNSLVGQQQVWIGTALAISIWLLLAKDSPAKSGIVQGITLCVTKVLVGLFWPVLFGASRRRWTWLAAAMMFPLCTAALFMSLGSDLLLGLRYEQQLVTSGNVLYYVEFLLRVGKSYYYLYDTFTVFCLLGVSSLIVIQLRGRYTEITAMVLSAVALILVTLLIVSKKSYSNYLSFAYCAVLFVLYSNVPRIFYWCAFFLFSVLASAAPSLWFFNRGNDRSLENWVSNLGWSAALPTVIMDCILISLYAITAYHAFQAVVSRNMPRCGP
jgi:hypothetical protein